MKKIVIVFAAIFLAVFVSCSSSGIDTKTITPTSTEFTSGELAKYVEIDDLASELTFAKKDGAIETQYIRLKVTLKMVKDGLKDIDARDIHFTGLMSVAIINLVDENGTDVQDLEVKSEDLLKLKKLLTGDEGDTAEIIFEGEFHNSDDAPKWFEEAAQFTPYITGDISVGESSESNNSESNNSESVDLDTDDNDSDDSVDSSGSDSKTITPTSTEFTDGEVARYIEIVNQPSKLTYTEKDGLFKIQYMSLKLTLKMVKDGLKNVNARDIDFPWILSGATIQLVDNDGARVLTLNIHNDLLKLKKLLTGKKGDTAEIIFDEEFLNEDDARNWFKRASQFSPSETSDISVKTSSK